MSDRQYAETTAPETTRDMRELLDERIASLTDWLKREAPTCAEEQRHLDEGTTERVYWHYGYLMALRDLRGAISPRRSALN